MAGCLCQYDQPPRAGCRGALVRSSHSQKNNRSPITLLKEHPFLSLAVVSLEHTTLKPLITIVHHVVDYQVEDNKDDQDSDGIKTGFHGVITQQSIENNSSFNIIVNRFQMTFLIT